MIVAEGEGAIVHAPPIPSCRAIVFVPGVWSPTTVPSRPLLHTDAYLVDEMARDM